MRDIQTVMDKPKTERVGLMNPSYKYIDSASTDIRKTFERIQKEKKDHIIKLSDPK